MVTGKDWEDQRFDRPGFHPKDPLPFPGLRDIGRFWRDLEAPGQVVTMQSRHDKDLCHAVGRRCRRELGRGSADRRHVGRVRLDSVSSIARPQASVVQCDVIGSVC
jgi:hypothetical protein